MLIFFVRCFEWQCARLKLSATWVMTFYQAATLRLRIAYNVSRGQGHANGLVQLHLGKRKGLLMWFLFCLPVFSFVGIFLCLILGGCARLLRCVREATKTRCAWLVKQHVALTFGTSKLKIGNRNLLCASDLAVSVFGHLPYSLVAQKAFQAQVFTEKRWLLPRKVNKCPLRLRLIRQVNKSFRAHGDQPSGPKPSKASASSFNSVVIRRQHCRHHSIRCATWWPVAGAKSSVLPGIRAIQWAVRQVWRTGEVTAASSEQIQSFATVSEPLWIRYIDRYLSKSLEV